MDRARAGVIPPILHRCVPAVVPSRFETYWRSWCAMHPLWEHRTWQDPIDPNRFPLTARAWPHVKAGAQLAGLVRLEAIWWQGGIFLDWDVRPIRALDELRPLSMFAAWEDDEHVPDAVFGAEAHHPAVGEIMRRAVELTVAGADPWATSVGLFTEVLPDRPDCTLLPSSSFYPVHYSDERSTPGASSQHVPGPDTFGVHEWAWSWRPGG